MIKPLLLGIGAGALITVFQLQLRSLKKEMYSMPLTPAQQKQFDDALAASNQKFLAIVLAAVLSESSEIKLELQVIESKVVEGTVTQADMQGLIAKINASPDNIKAAVEASIGGISKDSGADDAAAQQQGGGDPGTGGGPDPNAP